MKTLNVISKLNQTAKVLLVLFVAATMSACKKGQVSSSGGGSSSGGSITIDNAYPGSTALDPIPARAYSTPGQGGIKYIKGDVINVIGTCSRGIAEIRVTTSNALCVGDCAEVATCDQNLDFEWSKTVPGAQDEQQVTLTFTGYDLDGNAISGASDAVVVFPDDTAPPAAPGVTVGTSTGSGTVSYTHLSTTGAVYISDNTSAPSGARYTDWHRVTITGYGQSRVGSPNPLSATGLWTSSSMVTFPLGGPTNFEVYIYDLAGNQSPATTVEITWQVSAGGLRGAYAATGPATCTGCVGSSGLEVTMEEHVTPATCTGCVGSSGLDVGFNSILNKYR